MNTGYPKLKYASGKFA